MLYPAPTCYYVKHEFWADAGEEFDGDDGDNDDDCNDCNDYNDYNDNNNNNDYNDNVGHFSSRSQSNTSMYCLLYRAVEVESLQLRPLCHERIDMPKLSCPLGAIQKRSKIKPIIVWL